MKAEYDKKKFRRLRRGALPRPWDRWWCEMFDGTSQWYTLRKCDLLTKVLPSEIIIRRRPKAKP
jgi:hypothetical protein